MSDSAGVEGLTFAQHEGERSGSIRVYLSEVRYVADAMCSTAAEMAGLVVGDDETGGG